MCDNLNEIYYEGTTTEWNTIQLAEGWNAVSGGWYVSGRFSGETRDMIIHCSDGDTVVKGQIY